MGTVSSSGVFSPSGAGTATITATSTQDATKSGQTPVTVTAQSAVTISPASAQVQVFHQQQFTATSAGSSSAVFSWSVNGIVNGNLTVGQIDSTGLYTAPNNQPSPSQVTITATYQSDSTKTASASVTIGADAAPPAITSELPTADETGVSLDSAIQITFSNALDPSTVTFANFTLTNSSGTTLPLAVLYDPTSYSVSLTPRGLLSAGVEYTVSVSKTVADPAGETLLSPVSWTFTTESAVTASATIGTTLVSNPTTVTVISYGGQETVPDASGNFTASVAPLGNSVVAAMVPGKNFGWMAFVADQTSTSSQTAVKKVQANLARIQARPGSRPVTVTRYQVTSSATAAASPNVITADATTTAESMLFMTPYLYNSDPTEAATIQQVIASDPTIPALAQALTAAAGEADPLSDSAVQAGLVSSLTSVWSSLSSISTQSIEASAQDASSTAFQKPTGLNTFQIRAADATSSSSVLFTPYGYGCNPPSAGSQAFPCLDLDFIGLTLKGIDNSGFQFEISNDNCSHGLPSPSHYVGCILDWIVFIGPKDGSWKPTVPVQSIVAADGSLGKETASPVGTFDPNCSDSIPNDCLVTLQMTGRDTVDHVVDFLNITDPENMLTTIWDAALGVPEGDSATFTVPNAAGNYIMRAYSGGIGDPIELQNVLANQYDSNSKQLWLHALSNNLGHVILDDIGAAVGVFGVVNISPNDSEEMKQAKNLFSCIAGDAGKADDIVKSLVSVDTSSKGSFEAGIALIMKTAVDIALRNAGPCGTTVAKAAATHWYTEVLDTVMEKGKAIIDSGTATYKTGMNLGQLIRATPVETAIISVQSTNVSISVAGIEPRPMTTGSNSQSVTIDGSGFPADAMVSWKDPAGNVTGPFSPTAPVTSAAFKGWGNFTGKPGTWYVEIGDSLGNSGWFPFNVTTSSTATSDLVPQGVSVSPTSVAGGGTVTVTFTVANTGNMAAASSTTGFRLGTSPTTHPGVAGDIPNSLIPTRALAAGASIQQSQTLTIPASTPAGTYYIWVVVDDVASSTLGQSDQLNDYASSNALTISANQNPAPKVSGVAPTPVPASTTAATLTINGVNFVQGSTLIFYDSQKNQYLRSATFVNSGTLSHQFNNNADVGQWTIVVQNPDGQQSTPYTFQVSNSTTSPALQQIATAPNPPVPGQQFTLTLTGSGFDPSSAEILMSGLGCTPCVIANGALTTKTASQIVAGVTLNSTGTYSVTVENTASSAQSTALSLTVGASPMPSVSYILPTGMTANSASNPDATQPLQIHGSNFAPGNIVQFYWTQGSNAYAWNNSKSTPTITSSLITIPMDPGTVTDTIKVRVCESATQATASTCSSGIQAVTVTATTVAPSSPTGLAPGGSSQPGPTVTTLTPTLTWNISQGATSYSVAVSTASNAPVFSQNVTTNSLQIPSGHLSSGTTYVWALTANNSAGSSGMSTPVYFTVNVPTATPTISLSAGSLSFTGTSGSSNPGSQTVSISNSGTGTLNWTASVTSGANWLSVSPQSGTAPSTITASVNIVGLAAGVYNGNIAVAATGATNTPQNIIVALTLSSPPGQKPTATTGAATNPTATSATLNSTVSSNGADTTEYYQYGTTTGYGSTSGTQDIGAAPSPVSFPYTINNLTCNTVYHFRIVAQNSYGISYGTDAFFNTSACPATPTISLGAGSLSFTGTSGSSNPGSQTVSISNSGTGTLNWTASVTSGASWLSVSPQSGAAPSTITASVNIAGLAAGVYNGNIAVAATGATNTPQNIFVALTLSSPPGQKPTATTGAATNPTATSATLNSTVSSNGADTTEYYQYGTTTGYGSTSGTQDIGAAPSPVSFPYTINSLTCNTVYHFRIVAQNSYGTTNGTDVSFNTAVCPTPPPPSIDHIYPLTMTASTTALTTLYVYGYNFSTSGGQLQFLDPNNVQYSSNSHPERIVTVIQTEWVYNLNNGGTKGPWKVRVVNADSQPSGWATFSVQ